MYLSLKEMSFYSSKFYKSFPGRVIDHFKNDLLIYYQKELSNSPEGLGETTQILRDKWIREYSDHCLLYLEVQKV